MIGTAAVAIGTAAAVPRSIGDYWLAGGESVKRCVLVILRDLDSRCTSSFENGEWKVKKAVMSRSARVLDGRLGTRTQKMSRLNAVLTFSLN